MPHIYKFISILALLSASIAANEIETITVTANRATETVNQQVGSVSMLNQQQLSQIDAAHIQQSLNQVTGVNFARGNGQEYLPSLRSPILTGPGACGSVLSAVDGVPLRAAGFCNINELFEAPFEFAEQIEVVKGAWSTFYGSNAMNGVINVVSADINTNDNVASLSFGPNDYSKARISHNQITKEHSWRVDFAGKTDKGWRQESGYDSQKLSIKHQIDTSVVSITNLLALTNLNQETAGFIVGTDSYRSSALAKQNPNPEAFRDAKSVRFHSKIESSATDSLYSWLLIPYLRYTQMTFLQHFLPGQPLEENGHSSAGLQTKVSYQQGDSQISIGLDLERSSGFLTQFQANPTQGSDFLKATIPQGLHYDYQVVSKVLSPYLHYQSQLTHKLTFSAGVRFEKVEYDYKNNMLSGRTDENGVPCRFGGCRYSRPEDRVDSFSNLSPKFGLSYQFNVDNQLYFNLSQGFRAPQTTELYRLQRAQQVADLASEKLTSAEIGSRGHIYGIHYDLAIYAMQRNNVIIRDTDFFNITGGKTNSHGLELSADTWLSDWFNLSATLNYAHHTYGDTPVYIAANIDGNQVDSAPKHFGQLNAQIKATERLSLTLSLLKQGKYYTDAENAHQYSGHTLANLTAVYKAAPDITLYLRWLNMFDRAYADRADFSSFSGDRYFPGEPSSVYGNIEISY